MVSRKLMGAWVALDALLLSAGVVTLVLSFIWRDHNPLLDTVLPSAFLTAGTVLGVLFLITFAISIGAIVQRNHITIGLVILNYALLLDGIAVMVIGTFIWFFSLKELNNYHLRWLHSTPATRVILQDQFHCCGYFDGTDAAEIGGTFCQSQGFITGLAANVTSNFCMTPLTNFADMTLNNIFTTIYGFIAVLLCLLLASLCVIKKREEAERFKKIDAKRGGRGFV